MQLTDLQILLVALGLGLLVGLQREYTHNPLAGIRTFPLITLLGALSGLLVEPFGPWLFAATLLALVAFSVMGNLGLYRNQQLDPGLTTEIAMLTMFIVGALLSTGLTIVAVSVTGVVAVLLQGKQALHAFVNTFSEAELWMVTRYALIALVILPLLPNRDYGPYAVLNPFEIWLMVVLIVGISLGAYVAGRVWGGRGGTLIAGLLGGLISSTATTVSYAQRSKLPAQAKGAAFVVIMSASAVAFVRVLVEVAIVSPKSLSVVAPPLVVVMAVMFLVAAGGFWLTRSQATKEMTDEPSEGLGTAVVFGLLYAAILFAVAWARETVGTSGIYFVAGLSGLADVDAITLSTAQLMNDGRIEASVAWRVILISVLSNLIFKGLVVAAIGHRRLLGRVTLGFGLTLGAGVAALLLWPT